MDCLGRHSGITPLEIGSSRQSRVLRTVSVTQDFHPWAMPGFRPESLAPTTVSSDPFGELAGREIEALNALLEIVGGDLAGKVMLKPNQRDGMSDDREAHWVPAKQSADGMTQASRARAPGFRIPWMTHRRI